MQTWYYSSNGERQGPVSFDELKALARRGALDPVKDLAWTEGMQDWISSGQVAGLYHDLPMPASGAFNPYAAPGTASHDLLAPLPAGALFEVSAGSYPLDIMAILGRAIEITKRYFGPILVIGVVYILIAMALEAGLGLIRSTLESPRTHMSGPGSDWAAFLDNYTALGFTLSLISWVISNFFALGLTKAALSFVSGDGASVGTLFSQGDRLLRSLGATILYILIILGGTLLFIVPGIYLALRLVMYHDAIVDRNLGVMASLRYSWSLTKNNALSLFGLGIMGFLILIAGALALGVGLIFALPVVTLAFALAYRCLQFGRAAMADHPGTKTPLLQGRTSH